MAKRMVTKILSVILLVLIFWLQFQIWQIEKGQSNTEKFELNLKSISRLQFEIEEQIKQNQNLLERNKTLEKEIWLLRNDPSILEEKAREQLGLIKDGEIFYRIIPKDK